MTDDSPLVGSLNLKYVESIAKNFGSKVVGYIILKECSNTKFAGNLSNTWYNRFTAVAQWVSSIGRHNTRETVQESSLWR